MSSPPVFHLLETARSMTLNVDPQLGGNRDHEAVDLHVAADTRGLDEDARAVHLLHQPLGHW